MVLQEAVRLLDASVAEMVLALMAIPGRVISLLAVTPAVPAPATECFTRVIVMLHGEMK